MQRETKAERRQNKKINNNKMSVSGKSVFLIQTLINGRRKKKT